MRCRSVRVRVGKALDVGGGSGYSIAYVCDLSDDVIVVVTVSSPYARALEGANLLGARIVE